MNATAEHAERQRRATNKEKVLAYLLAHGSATNVELAQVGGMRFGGRIEELRKAGWPIETQSLGRGLFRYDLPRPGAGRPAAVFVFMSG